MKAVTLAVLASSPTVLLAALGALALVVVAGVVGLWMLMRHSYNLKVHSGSTRVDLTPSAPSAVSAHPPTLAARE